MPTFFFSHPINFLCYTDCMFDISQMQPLSSSACTSPPQEDGLHQIFVLTMEVLQEFSRRENLNAQMSSVFQRYLALANQVLSWNFLPPNDILCHVGVTSWFIF